MSDKTQQELQEFYDHNKDELFQLYHYGESSTITLHDLIMLVRNVVVTLPEPPNE